MPAEELRKRVEERLPPGVASVWAECSGRAPLSGGELGESVEGYLSTLAATAASNEFLDMDTAREVGSACLRLIEQYAEHPAADVRAVVQTAVAYFIEADDEEGDTTSIVGFDDDALVVRVAAAVLREQDGDASGRA